MLEVRSTHFLKSLCNFIIVEENTHFWGAYQKGWICLLSKQLFCCPFVYSIWCDSCLLWVNVSFIHLHYKWYCGYIACWSLLLLMVSVKSIDLDHTLFANEISGWIWRLPYFKVIDVSRSVDNLPRRLLPNTWREIRNCSDSNFVSEIWRGVLWASLTRYL